MHVPAAAAPSHIQWTDAPSDFYGSWKYVQVEGLLQMRIDGIYTDKVSRVRVMGGSMFFARGREKKLIVEVTLPGL